MCLSKLDYKPFSYRCDPKDKDDTCADQTFFDLWQFLFRELNEVTKNLDIIWAKVQEAPEVKMTAKEMKHYAQNGGIDNLPPNLRNLSLDQKYTIVLKYAHWQAKVCVDMIKASIEAISKSMLECNVRYGDAMNDYLKDCFTSLKKIKKTCIEVNQASKKYCANSFHKIYQTFLNSYSKIETEAITDAIKMGSVFGVIIGLLGGCVGVSFLSQMAGLITFGVIGGVAGGGIGFTVVHAYRWWTTEKKIERMNSTYPNQSAEYIEERKKICEKIQKEYAKKGEIPPSDMFVEMADCHTEFTSSFKSPVSEFTKCACCHAVFTQEEVHPPMNQCDKVVKFQAVPGCRRGGLHFTHTSGNCKTAAGRHRFDRYCKDPKMSCVACNPQT